ncbi:hypothetical protein ACFSQ3_11330 [Sphingobacterium corticis]|uniref:Rhodanese domain-containing protein n=1 Tax=Sphingobacterium corticis TaxID=1812823 RepID=A0ABW5NLE7_9SPHI
MKSTLLNQANLLKLKALLCAITFVALFHSCKTSLDNSELGNGELVLIQVSVSGSSYDGEEQIGDRAARLNQNGTTSEHLPTTQISTAQLDDDLMIVAELEPVLSNQAISNELPSGLKGSAKAQTVIDPISRSIRYRLVVFDASGNYVTERDYRTGAEANTEQLKLNGGGTYTFVAYSVNSDTSLPDVAYANNSARTLAGANLTVGGTTDLMFFRRRMTITGNNENNLDIVLKHRLSQITTTINSSSTGYTITELTASFTPHQNNATINFDTEALSRSTESGSVSPITFGALSSEDIVGSPTIVNSVAAGNASLTLNSIRIGEVSLTNVVPFRTLTITPGVKYNLRLNIVPNDQNITFQGVRAVRIAGVVWALRNLGADQNISVDSNPYVSGLHGGFYQWGLRDTSASGTAIAINNVPARFNGNNNPPNNSWNSGSETLPAKSNMDPCPANFRIPTKNEANLLITNTTAVSRPIPLTQGPNIFSNVKILTSKRNANVRLFFPLQGFFPTMSNNGNNTYPFSPQGISRRGELGRYWVSYVEGEFGTNRIIFDSGAPKVELATGNNGSNKVTSSNIRCVGIQP